MSRGVILYDANRNPMSVQNGVAIPANTNGLLVHGSDGTNARVLSIAASNALKIVDVGSRIVTGTYSAATSLITGSGSSQNLASIENPSASGKTVFVRRITLMSTVGAAASAKFLFHVGRTTATPSSGTTLTAQKHKTGDSSPVAIVRSVPTATAATGDIWVGTPGTQVSNAAYVGVPLDALKGIVEFDDIQLDASEGLVVSAEANDIDFSFSVSFSWVEA